MRGDEFGLPTLRKSGVQEDVGVSCVKDHKGRPIEVDNIVREPIYVENKTWEKCDLSNTKSKLEGMNEKGKEDPASKSWSRVVKNSPPPAKILLLIMFLCQRGKINFSTR